MVWSDMIAVVYNFRTLDPAFLRRYCAADRRVRVESILQDEGRLEWTWPAAPRDLAERHAYRGDLFAPMVLGNLVHTSSVVSRRNRLTAICGFDNRLERLGEDYDFYLRTCLMGLVAFLDASAILCRVGAADQWTAPRCRIGLACSNLETVKHPLVKGEARSRWVTGCCSSEWPSRSRGWASRNAAPDKTKKRATTSERTSHCREARPVGWACLPSASSHTRHSTQSTGPASGGVGDRKIRTTNAGSCFSCRRGGPDTVAIFHRLALTAR